MALLTAVLLAWVLAGDAQTTDLREVLRQALANQERTDKIADDYAYRQRVVTRHLDAGGKVTKTGIRTFDVVTIEGTPSKRLVARDDRPLSAGEDRIEKERLDKETGKRKNESPADGQKRLERYRQEKEEEAEMDREVLDAYDFRLAGHETIDGIPCLVVQATPRPAFQPRKRTAAFLKHLAGRAWITEDTRDLVKIDATVIDDISFGWFLATLNKGAHLVIEMARINGEVWLPRSLSARIGARALVKRLNIEQEQTFSDYKKFRVDSRIVGIAPPQ